MARHVTPVPEEDGPNGEATGQHVLVPRYPALHALSEVVSKWKVLLSTAVALVVMGFVARAYLEDLATHADVAAAVQNAVAPVVGVYNQVNGHEARIRVLESLQKDQVVRDRIQSQQLFHIATKIGAPIAPGIRADAGP